MVGSCSEPIKANKITVAQNSRFSIFNQTEQQQQRDDNFIMRLADLHELRSCSSLGFVQNQMRIMHAINDPSAFRGQFFFNSGIAICTHWVIVISYHKLVLCHYNNNISKLPCSTLAGHCSGKYRSMVRFVMFSSTTT